MTSSYGTGIAASGSKDAPSVGQSTGVIPSGACSRSRRTRSAEDEQRQGRSVLAHDHSAPVHRLYMHRLERLHGAIASVGAYPGELTAILDLAAGLRSSSRPVVITNALACPRFESTADSSGLDVVDGAAMDLAAPLISDAGALPTRGGRWIAHRFIKFPVIS